MPINSLSKPKKEKIEEEGNRKGRKRERRRKKGVMVLEICSKTPKEGYIFLITIL